MRCWKHSSYCPTTRSPHGDASFRRSLASPLTHVNFAAAVEPRLNAVLDLARQVQGRTPTDERNVRRSHRSPRGRCESGRRGRSQPVSLRVKGLRHNTTLHWRYGSVVSPVASEQGSPGARVNHRHQGRGPRVGLDSSHRARCAHPHAHPVTGQSSVIRQAGGHMRQPLGARSSTVPTTLRARTRDNCCIRFLQGGARVSLGAHDQERNTLWIP